MKAKPAGLVVRDALPTDREAIRRVTLAAYGEYASTMEPTAWAGLEGAVRNALEVWEGVDWIVAESAEAVVGSVALYPPSVDAYHGAAVPADWPELRLLAVSPAARGRGIGRALVAACVRRATEHGASHLGLHTSRSMTAAIRMYERMGFIRSPAHDFQPEGAELVTAYRLPLASQGS